MCSDARYPFFGHNTPWSFFVTGPIPLYTNFRTRWPRYVSAVKMLPLESVAMLWTA